MLSTDLSIDNSTTIIENTFNEGHTYTTINDNSYHDNSKHHHGDTYITNNHHDSKNHGLQRAHERALDKLESKISRGAAHDSAERGPHAPKCDEGTREAVQDDILSWIDRGIRATLPREDWLAGSFFFSDFAGQPDRYSKEYLFPTLAYHFIHLNIPGLREEILSAIDTCPSVFDKRLDDQLRILILEPLRKVDHAVVQSSFKTIIVDGVDECKRKARNTWQDHRMSKEDNHREIISSLVRASRDPSFPFRIIIVSRPERAIERRFDSFQNYGIKFKRVFLDEKYEPQADIELFLRARFETIGRDHGLPDQWYREDIPRYLAEEASGQFIYAATIIRYVQDGKDTPHEQLKRVLNWKGAKGSRPFAALDALYTGILQRSPYPELSVKWIRAFSVPYASWDLQKPWYKKTILEASPGQTEVVLGKLTALIGLNDNHRQPTFTFYHKSLTDFLEDKDRSGDLHLEKQEVEQFLVERHYQVLKNRGPQGWLPPDLQRFYSTFRSEFRFRIDPDRQYDASDVEWWITLLDDPPQSIGFASLMFEEVHNQVSNIFDRSGFSPGPWALILPLFFPVSPVPLPPSLSSMEERNSATLERYRLSSPNSFRPLPSQVPEVATVRTDSLQLQDNQVMESGSTQSSSKLIWF
ncbi:hypothetical protein NMY22_g13155 [Coprinellus aureogranulatus]|nr:hypothetical protein NMY22_g13155 [Coprinellus aureogranulatus]